ncbi:membrane-anchored junction protein isoform X1 [Callithrix jacchus]|uniref:membrane-anchored junction protein isoform X1 n=1 Tax=Callithrix jacchus TaxID=9483 RepID=UPI0023DD4FE6|nr:membrane-anchored junction protein isoform X1 [Callithrix jacchus]
MSLKPFTYPFPETRFLHAGSSVYKFKIRYGNSIRGEEIEDKAVIIRELEDSIRVVLGNLDNLQPFATEHFVVFPYKSKWERVSHLKFKHGEVILIPYPFVFTLYVEMKCFHENLSPGKWNDVDSREENGLAVPAGYGEMGHWIGLQPHSAQVPAEKKAVGAVMKRKHVDAPSSPSRPELDRSVVWGDRLTPASSLGFTSYHYWLILSFGSTQGLPVKAPAKRSPLWKPGETGKEKPNKDCRRLWPLISLMSRNKILSGDTACQGQLSHCCSTTHLHLRSKKAVASLSF